MFFPDPGSRIRLFSIPNPVSELIPSRIPDPGSASMNLSILIQKWFLENMILVVHPGSGFLLFNHPGSRGQKGTRSWIRITASGQTYFVSIFS
jgi:hypothetical protein